MSEVTTTESTAPTDTGVESTATEATTAESTSTTEVDKTEAQPEQKFEYPKKFLKADGTPDYERLAKSYVGLEKKLGAKPNIPAASADEYEWTAPENAVELDAEGLTKFKTEALEQGFTPKQYEFLMNRYNDVVVGMRDSGPTPEKAEATLKAEWGNEYKDQLKKAHAGFQEFAPSSADMNDPVWNHPEVMKLLARLGNEVREDSVKSKSPATGGESVQAQIDALRNSPDYWTAENQAKVLALYEKLN